MHFLMGALIVAAAVAVAVAAMLGVRRRAPEGSYFSDGDRASGVFGVLATGFALLLGLIVFLAFTSYDDSKTGSEAGAINPWALAMFRTMQAVLPATAVYMLFFADSGERAVVQGLLMGSVVAVIVATLLLIGILDRPYRPGLGELRPVAMRQTLVLIDQARDALGQDDPLPCGAEGRPV
jgi:hypothetical protein